MDNNKDENNIQEQLEDVAKQKEDFFDVQKKLTKKDKKNEPLKQNRTMILAVILGFLSLIIFFSVFFKPAKKKPKEIEIEQARKVYIPELTFSQEKKQEIIEIHDHHFEVVDVQTDDEVLATIPFSDEAMQKAPVELPQQKAPASTQTQSSSRPQTTNTNPIQKQITRIAWNESSNNQDFLNQSDNPYAQFGLPAKDEYLNQLVSSQSPNSIHYQNSFASSYEVANNQTGKQAFANHGVENVGKSQWNNEISLFKGTIIPAVLETGINTDLPGVVIARVTQNIYSSLDGSYLLIPSGSRLYATYNSSISYSQNRVQVAWDTLIRPDGFEMSLGNMPGVDAQGYAGYGAKRDEHFFEYLKAMGLISAFTVAMGEFDYAAKNITNQNAYVDALIAENRAVINQLGSKIIDRALDVQPTLRVKQGTVVNIITNTTIVFPPLEPNKPTTRYVRY